MQLLFLWYNEQKGGIFMSEIIPFITLKDCLKAIEYYKEVLDAKLVGEMTMMNNIKGYEKDIYKDMVGHATLSIGGSKIFLNDYSDDNLQKMGNNIQFVLNLADEDSLKSKFYKIAEEGAIIYDLEEVFWGALFGTVKDKYGIYWQLYYGHK
jgi:PhnB protein